MDNIKILVLIIITLLAILFITTSNSSNSSNIELLENTNQDSVQKVSVDLEKFIKNNTKSTDTFILSDEYLEFKISKDPISLLVDNTNKYLIYNSNKNNMLFIGSIDIQSDDIKALQKNDKAFVIIILKNIYVVTDSSGNIDPNFTVNSYIINNINSTQFAFDNGNLIINSVDNFGNNVIINKKNEISGPDTILNIDDNGLNVLNVSTLNKKQLISYDELQKTLRPCYTQTYKQNTKQIIGLMVYLLQKYRP